MTLSQLTNRRLAIGIPAAIFVSCILIRFSPLVHSQPQKLSLAITLDLLVTAPLAYLLIIRNTAVSKLSVLRVFIIGVLIAGLLIPSGSNTLLQVVKTWVSPFVELMLLFFVIRKFYHARKKERTLPGSGPDFISTCRLVLKEVIGNEKAANIFSSEVAVFYYAFFSRKNVHINNSTVFRSYKKNGVLLLLYSILFLFLIETLGMHFLLLIWSKKAAWILTTLSAYTCLQLFAHIKAIKARPVCICDDGLYVRHGLAADAIIPYTSIHKIELTNKNVKGNETIKMGLTKTLEEHNVAIHLTQPVEVTRFFGIKKKALVILFFVENPVALQHSLQSKINA